MLVYVFNFNLFEFSVAILETVLTLPTLPNLLLLVIFDFFPLLILLDPEQPEVGPPDQSSAPSLPPTNLEQGAGELVQSDEEEEET